MLHCGELLRAENKRKSKGNVGEPGGGWGWGWGETEGGGSWCEMYANWSLVPGVRYGTNSGYSVCTASPRCLHLCYPVSKTKPSRQINITPKFLFMPLPIDLFYVFLSLILSSRLSTFLPSLHCFIIYVYHVFSPPFLILFCST